MRISIGTRQPALSGISSPIIDRKLWKFMDFIRKAYMGRRPATFYIPVNDGRMNYTYGGVEITAQFGTSSFKIENGRA